MIALGIETSCDETAIAVSDDNRILSNSVSSSVHFHKDFGGVIPEIACRYHVEYINYVLADALRKAKISLDDINLIAVTAKPGLIGALLVGVSMAEALSMAKGVPLINVDHLMAHLYAVFMEGKKIRFPFIGLVVSGGHTSLFRVNGIGAYRLLGQTLDDAAGEAFDKVAKLLGLGYPGGPVIQKRAESGKIDKGLFPKEGHGRSLDFSFSGIKTSVLYHVRDRLRKKNLLKGRGNKAGEISRSAAKLGKRHIDDIAASFQDSITDILAEKALTACRREGVRRLVLGGGVSANTMLRRKIAAKSAENGISPFVPGIKLCLDNAAMVAGLGAALYKKSKRGGL